MSIKLMAAAWEIAPKTLPKGCKFLLIALCDNANDQGMCYPSIEYLANKCEMCTRTVQNHVQWLAEHGYLTLEERKGRSTIYTIDYAALLHPPMVQTETKSSSVVSHPRKICTPASSSKTPAKFAPTPANFSKTPAKFAPITITNHHLTTTEPPPAEKTVDSAAAEVVVVGDAAQLEKQLPWPAGLSAEQRQRGAKLLCGLPVAQAEVCVRLLAQALASRDVPKPAGYLAALAVRARAGTLDVGALESTAAVRAEQAPVSAAHRDWREVKAEAGQVSAAEKAADAAHFERLKKLGVTR